MQKLSNNEDKIMRNYKKANNEQLSTLQDKLQQIINNSTINFRTKHYYSTQLQAIDAEQQRRKPFYKRMLGWGGKTRRHRSRSRRTRRR